MSAPAVVSAPAAPLNLDPTFGGYGLAGRVLSDLFPGTQIRDVLLLPDQRLVAVGSDGADMLVARFFPDGQLDPDFGVDGVTRLNFANQLDVAFAVALDPDGKLLIAGATSPSLLGDGDFAVARLLADGDPDPAFSLDGLQTIDFNGLNDRARFVLPYSRTGFTGRIVVGGSAEENTSPLCLPACPTNLALARLNDNGSLDTGFNGTGKFQPAFDRSEVGLAAANDAGTGGLYVVGGRTGGVAEHLVVHVSQSGSLYPLFGGDGIVTGTVPSTLVDVARAGSQYVAVGAAGDDFGLLGFNGDGDPASGFGSSGVQLADLGGADVAQALLPLLDRTFAVGGVSDAGLALARFDTHGALLPGSTVITTLADAGATLAQAHAVALLPDLRLWTVGSFEAGVEHRLALTRHFLNFTPDSGGRQATDFGNTSIYANDQHNADRAQAAAWQPDGKLLAAGRSTALNAPPVAAIARYHPDGSLDAAFGAGGLQLLPVLSQTVALAVAPGDKIMLAGDAFNLLRLDAAGSPDPAFNGAGYASANWADATSYALAVQGDGKPLLAGEVRGDGGSVSMALARFDLDGTLDETFGIDGLVRTGIALRAGAFALALQPDGKIVVAGGVVGSLADPLTVDLALVRYHPNGDLDQSFDGDGKLITDFGSVDLAQAVLVQPDGRIVAAGVSANQGMAFARFLPTGAPDPTFDGDGKLLLQFVDDEAVLDLALDGSDLVAAACAEGAQRGWVVRLTASGALDQRLNGTGRARLGLAETECPLAVAAGSGRYAAAGYALGLSEDFALAVFASPEPYRLFLPLQQR
jgi:uncharacterized delta-60 repeat protein